MEYGELESNNNQATTNNVDGRKKLLSNLLANSDGSTRETTLFEDDVDGEEDGVLFYEQGEAEEDPKRSYAEETSAVTVEAEDFPLNGPSERRGKRRVSIGWLQEVDEGLRISLAGLVASLALNAQRQADGISMEEKAWFDILVKRVSISFLHLSEDVTRGILPLGMIGSDAEPFADQWNSNLCEEDRERAFGELFAQSILEIGARDAGKSKRYDSRTHWCLTRVGKHLNIARDCIEEYEEMIAGLVTEAAQATENLEMDEEEKKQKSRSRFIRNLKVGTAAIVGATLVGVTGGLALPAIGASLATFGGAAAATGAFMASAGGTALFTTLFTAGGLGLTGYKMNRRIGSSLKQFEFHEILNQDTEEPFPQGLHVCICVSGWYVPKKKKKRKKSTPNDSQGSSTQTHASTADESNSTADSESAEPNVEDKRTDRQDSAEALDSVEGVDEFSPNEWTECVTVERSLLGQPFQLVWETEVLKSVSNALQQFALNQALSKAVSETLKVTTFAAVMAAVAWPNFLLSATSFIDNPWAVAENRAKLAGEELARAILSGAHGQRPVTLVGYSLGGLVVFHCLEYLFKKKKSRLSSVDVDGLLLNVIIMGAPITASKEHWAQVRTIVAGSLVNCYAPNDWVLAVLYRASTLTFSQVAGLYKVSVPGVLDIDLAQAGIVNSQFDYHKKLAQCTRLVMERIAEGL